MFIVMVCRDWGGARFCRKLADDLFVVCDLVAFFSEKVRVVIIVEVTRTAVRHTHSLKTFFFVHLEQIAVASEQKKNFILHTCLSIS